MILISWSLVSTFRAAALIDTLICSRLQKRSARILPRRSRYIPLTPEEARETKPLYLGMITAHVLLYDREAFFATLLQRLKDRLAELGSERRLDKDGYAYWVLTPDFKPGEVMGL